MPRVHVLSLKLGTSHGLWQYKVRGTHERVILHGLQPILDAACRRLAYPWADRSVVYLFHFSAEPFEGGQIVLERLRESSQGCYYRVVQSAGGDAAALRGLLPIDLKRDYLQVWPERIYVKLERSNTGGIVS